MTVTVASMASVETRAFACAIRCGKDLIVRPCEQFQDNARLDTKVRRMEVVFLRGEALCCGVTMGGIT